MDRSGVCTAIIGADLRRSGLRVKQCQIWLETSGLEALRRLPSISWGDGNWRLRFFSLHDNAYRHLNVQIPEQAIIGMTLAYSSNLRERIGQQCYSWKRDNMRESQHTQLLVYRRSGLHGNLYGRTQIPFDLYSCRETQFLVYLVRSECKASIINNLFKLRNYQRCLPVPKLGLWKVGLYGTKSFSVGKNPQLPILPPLALKASPHVVYFLQWETTPSLREKLLLWLVQLSVWFGHRKP